MNVPSILVVEDNTTLGRYMQETLEETGYLVTHAASGGSAYNHLRQEKFDLVLLDLKLGDADGQDILKVIRQKDDTTPVIIVSTFMDLNTKVSNFELGCDDYLTKPFYTEELISRVYRQLRRKTLLHEKNAFTDKEDLVCGPFRINLKSCEVYKNNQRLEMRKQLFRILQFFIQHPHQVMSKEQVRKNCWDKETGVTDNTLYVHIRQLRNVIEDDPDNPRYLRTLWRIGFRFDPDGPKS